MAYVVLMPQLGLTMEEGTVSQWIKHEGDAVKAGDVVVEITTDKLTNENTSEQDGVLLKIVAQDGEDVPVKGLLAYIGQPGEQVGETTAPAVSAASAAPSAEPAAALASAPAASPAAGGKRIRISPLARKIAGQMGVDYTVLTGPKTLSVKKSDGSVEERTADAIIVATGSVNAQPPIPGLKENPNCIDSTGALSLEKLPKSMVVIGGGVIGLELACAYAAFGTKITVVEALDHMLPMLDGDLTAIGVKHMKKMGMEFNLECPVQAVEASPVGAKVVCKNKAGETVSFEAEKVLVAIGRKANTASLNLEAAGLANDRGRIIVNDKMETSVPGVYAIGDCVFGKAQLAHTASAMGEVAAENIMGIPAVYDEKTNPTCVYMEPEAASVGLTEEQCKAKGIDYKVGKFPLVANGKSLIINGGEGLVKIIADATYEEVLGMHIIGPRATDLIAEGALALRLEATVDELISTIHSHPTVSESVRECALNVQKRAIHIKN